MSLLQKIADIENEGAKIQLLDLPGIIEGAKDGKGRGRQVIAVARTCSLILIVLDVSKPLQHKRLIEYELEGFGIRLNKQPPNLSFKKKDKGGINLTALVPQTELDLETVKQELDVIYKIPHCVPISAHHKWNFDDLLNKIWVYLNLVRIYTKPKGHLPDYSAPIVLNANTKTVDDLCIKIHKSLQKDFKCSAEFTEPTTHYSMGVEDPAFLQLQHEKERLAQRCALLEQYLEENEGTPTPANDSNALAAQIAELQREKEILLVNSQNVLSEINRRHADTEKKLEKRIAVLEEENRYLVNIKNESFQNETRTDREQELQVALDALKEQNEQLCAELERLRSELNEKIDENSSLVKDCGELREQKKEYQEKLEFQMDLNRQLQESQTGGLVLEGAARGNSMFGEFVDERKNLEKDLKRMHHELKSLRIQNAAQAGELDEMRRRANQNVGITSGPAKECRCQDVEQEIETLRNENSFFEQTLLAKVENGLALTSTQEAQRFKADLEFLKSNLTRMRNERDQAKDTCIIEQNRSRNAERECALLKTQKDRLQAIVDDHPHRMATVISGDDTATEQLLAPQKPKPFTTPMADAPGTSRLPRPAAASTTSQAALMGMLQSEKRAGKVKATVVSDADILSRTLKTGEKENQPRIGPAQSVQKPAKTITPFFYSTPKKTASS
ncbi:unnamed protein product, partial [Mesorhabditis spiculigera]